MANGTIYLIHFSRPYQAQSGKGEKQVSHYLGWAKNLPARIAHHRANRGARLIAVINEAGIEWEVVRTWQGDKNEERRLKNWKKVPVSVSGLSRRED